MPCRLGPRGRRRSDLNGQQNRTVSPARFRSSRLPSPCEEQALRNAVSPRHLAHHGPRHQRLFNDPRLLVLAPTPSALDPENLPIHLCMTLRLAQRSHPSRRTPSQQGGRRRTDTLLEPPVRLDMLAPEQAARPLLASGGLHPFADDVLLAQGAAKLDRDGAGAPCTCSIKTGCRTAPRARGAPSGPSCCCRLLTSGPTRPLLVSCSGITTRHCRSRPHRGYGRVRVLAVAHRRSLRPSSRSASRPSAQRISDDRRGLQDLAT